MTTKEQKAAEKWAEFWFRYQDVSGVELRVANEAFLAGVAWQKKQKIHYGVWRIKGGLQIREKKEAKKK